MYYDNIGSIVPQSYFYYPEESYHPFMLELVRINLVTPIDPMHVLDDPFTLAERFMELIEKNKGKLITSHTTRGKEREVFLNSTGTVKVRIHRNKFDYELFKYLIDVGLAEQQKDERWG